MTEKQTPLKPCEAVGNEYCWTHDRPGRECADQPPQLLTDERKAALDALTDMAIRLNDIDGKYGWRKEYETIRAALTTAAVQVPQEPDEYLSEIIETANMLDKADISDRHFRNLISSLIIQTQKDILTRKEAALKGGTND